MLSVPDASEPLTGYDVGGVAPLKVLGAAARAAERAGADSTGRALVTKARLIVQRKGITAAFTKPFADADHLLLTGHYEEAVAKPAQAYRSA
ncbi:hypothetical protein ASD08_12700 [Streptomyces sp. Root369]|nr:hypothetical protein ASD08_12700 [Streptomyces sp. Root369]